MNTHITKLLKKKLEYENYLANVDKQASNAEIKNALIDLYLDELRIIDKELRSWDGSL